ncbi:MAG TPA: malto-oligosyltrehalose synthase, partial [Verrucomicrobiae bacterium]|nr:malto-oligosyltrehalose synthase [Verrucomicrobiae bacterium]
MSDPTTEPVLPLPRIPGSTYRLQFTAAFGFRDAERIIPYLHELGITDMYASPYLKAKQGSLHGYDVVDPRLLNPEIGSEEEYERMVAALHARDMGQLLDIVPNHMGISGGDNRWWMDVLESGPGALHAPYFDINWLPVTPQLSNRVLIPVLGDQYGNVLDRGELRLVLEGGAFFIQYWENRFPLRPRSYSQILEHRLEEFEGEQGATAPHVLELRSIITQIGNLPLYTEVSPRNIAERYREKEIVKRRLHDLREDSPEVREFLDENVRLFNGTPGDTRSFDLLDRLLGDQIFRLAHWRVATEEINYRRFFDINEMAAIHVEYPHVFRGTHSFILRLVREGKVTGLRVDHPDGLYNPTEYFHRLQQACLAELAGIGLDQAEELYRKRVKEDPRYKPMYIVGEKILMPDEKLREDWPIYSTTGYIFSHYLNGLFVEEGNADIFDEIFASFTGERRPFDEILYADKKLIMSTMASEINTLGHYLDMIAEGDRHTRDFTRNSLTTAITEVIAHFPVYRTYITPAGVSEADRGYIESAVARAKERNPGINESIFNFLREVLLLRLPEGHTEETRKQWVDFVMKFQQLTGPFMAKGMEDTSFYVYNRLISLNDVGGNPARFGESLESFHRQNLERCSEWPHSLLASSTHDSKRGEDVRARINVISEFPQEWGELVQRWARLNAPKKRVLEGRKVPSPNAEYFLYQTLVGASPAGPLGNEEYDELRRRVQEALIKGAREAKRNTSWINPNARYEEALTAFVDAVLAR